MPLIFGGEYLNNNTIWVKSACNTRTYVCLINLGGCWNNLEQVRLRALRFYALWLQKNCWAMCAFGAQGPCAQFHTGTIQGTFVTAQNGTFNARVNYPLRKTLRHICPHVGGQLCCRELLWKAMSSPNNSGDGDRERTEETPTADAQAAAVCANARTDHLFNCTPGNLWDCECGPLRGSIAAIVQIMQHTEISKFIIKIWKFWMRRNYLSSGKRQWNLLGISFWVHLGMDSWVCQKRPAIQVVGKNTWSCPKCHAAHWLRMGDISWFWNLWIQGDIWYFVDAPHC